MSDYTKTTNFTAKDTVQAVILGSEHDAEFNAISESASTKADKISAPTADNLVSMNADGNIEDSGHSKYELWTMGTKEAIGTSSLKSVSLSGTVEEVEVIFTGLQIGTTNELLLALGTGGSPVYSGYATGAEGYFGQRGNSSFSGFYLTHTDAVAAPLEGVLTLRHMGSHQWVMTGTIRETATPQLIYVAGTKTLSGALDTVTLRVDAGLDTFTAGGYVKVNYRRSA